jgi:hypothetical protein
MGPYLLDIMLYLVLGTGESFSYLIALVIIGIKPLTVETELFHAAGDSGIIKKFFLCHIYKYNVFRPEISELIAFNPDFVLGGDARCVDGSMIGASARQPVRLSHALRSSEGTKKCLSVSEPNA